MDSNQEFGPNQSTAFPDLLAAARNGDSAAVGQLLDTYGDYLRAIADGAIDSGLRAKESPSDLTQKTFLEAHCSIDQFRGTSEGELRQWLTNILQHNVADLGRRYRKTQKRALAQEIRLGEELPSNDPSPSSPMRRREQDAELEAAIQRLPPSYRQAVELRHRENLEFAALGERLGVSAEAARKLWVRAIESLRRELTHEH